MKKFSFLSLIIIPLFTFGQDHLPAYKLYNKNGEATDFSKLVKKATEADVILFGEQHNNPIAHWLELELAKAIHKRIGDSLVMGAEMFERDDQLIINEYLAGLIQEKNLKEEVKLWDNYETDYRPLLEFAKNKRLDFIATNIPRRYASFVAHNGVKALDTFQGRARNYFPPLPIKMNMDLPGYKKIQKMSMHGGNMEYIAQAQAVKDATMTHSILNNWQQNEVFLHYNGNYHSKNFEGIYWYLKENNSDLEVLTIATVEQPAVRKLKEGNQEMADFIICTPSDMTKTY